MKKVLVILGILAVVILGYMISSGYFGRHFNEVLIDAAAVTQVEKIDFGTEKILTVYFSRVGNSQFEPSVDAVTSASLSKDKASSEIYGNTQLLAQMIKNSVGGDIYMIDTAKVYPSSYNDTVIECGKENQEEAPLEFKGELPDLAAYDAVFVVYPVWWGTIPKAVKNFAERLDFSGKKVFAVASHGGSGKAKSASDLETAAKIKLAGPVLEVFDSKTYTAAGVLTDWIRQIKG